jgi:hypothetical protein
MYNELLSSSSEFLLALIPVIIIQTCLVIYCLTKIVKEGTNNLNKWIWAVIVIFANLFGPIIFLTVGRRKDI